MGSSVLKILSFEKDFVWEFVPFLLRIPFQCSDYHIGFEFGIVNPSGLGEGGSGLGKVISVVHYFSDTDTGLGAIGLLSLLSLGTVARDMFWLEAFETFPSLHEGIPFFFSKGV
jgi:hypothetical protein